MCYSKKNRQHNWPKEKVQKDKQRSTKLTHLSTKYATLLFVECYNPSDSVVLREE